MGVDRCSTPIFVDVTGLLSDSPLCNVTPPHRIPPKMDDHKQRGRRLIAKNSIFNLADEVLSIATMLLGYFNIFDLGLSRATVKFVAENLDPENLHKVPALIWTSLSLLVGLGIVGGVVAALFVPISVTHLFKMPAELAGEA